MKELHQKQGEEAEDMEAADAKKTDVKETPYSTATAQCHFGSRILKGRGGYRCVSTSGGLTFIPWSSYEGGDVTDWADVRLKSKVSGVSRVSSQRGVSHYCAKQAGRAPFIHSFRISHESCVALFAPFNNGENVTGLKCCDENEIG